jgi:hypothetical protein
MTIPPRAPGLPSRPRARELFSDDDNARGVDAGLAEDGMESAGSASQPYLF